MPTTLQASIETPIREELCEELEQKIIDTLNTAGLNLRELVWVIGRLSIDTGASLEGKTSTPVTQANAWTGYTDNPTIGNALIASGFDMLSWLKLGE